MEKISSAIRNLLSNAFKYTSPNGKVIFKMNRIEIDGYSLSLIHIYSAYRIPRSLRDTAYQAIKSKEKLSRKLVHDPSLSLIHI